jgi:Flp pilus assembly protein TadG
LFRRVYELVVRDERGAAALELALLLPVLMLILIGTVDFGRFAHAAITITNAAQTGAAYCVYTHECDDDVELPIAQIEAAARREAQPFLADPSIIIAVSRPNTPVNPCPCLQVEVRYEFQTLIDWEAFGLPHDFWIVRAARVPRSIE